MSKCIVCKKEVPIGMGVKWFTTPLPIMHLNNYYVVCENHSNVNYGFYDFYDNKGNLKERK